MPLGQRIERKANLAAVELKAAIAQPPAVGHQRKARGTQCPWARMRLINGRPEHIDHRLEHACVKAGDRAELRSDSHRDIPIPEQYALESIQAAVNRGQRARR